MAALRLNAVEQLPDKLLVELNQLSLLQLIETLMPASPSFCLGVGFWVSIGAVSYTHLTLPTILLV